MNYEKLLLVKALDGDVAHRERSFRELINAGISAMYFTEHPEYWNFVVDHKKKHKTYPAIGTFFKHIKVKSKPVVDEPLTYYIDEIGKKLRHEIVSNAMDKSDNLLEKGDPDAAILALRSELKKIDATFNTKDLSVTDSVDERVAAYEYRIKNPGVDGIPSGLHRLDLATYGWHPGEFIMLAAYLGSYKTWTLLYMVHAAMKAGYKPMIATVEMGQMQIARRLDSILSNTEFEKMRAGSFADAKEIAAFKQRMDSIKGMNDCVVIGGISFSTLFLQAKIEEHQPDMLFVDGLYLIEGEQKKAQWEQLNMIARDLKVIAEGYSIPVLATTQGWKTSKKPGSTGAETTSDVAFSGGMMQHADVGISIGRIYDSVIEAYTNRVWIKTTKLREGEPVKFQVEFDFQNMGMAESLNVADHRHSPLKTETALVEGVDYNKGVKPGVSADDETPF